MKNTILLGILGAILIGGGVIAAQTVTIRTHEPVLREVLNYKRDVNGASFRVTGVKGAYLKVNNTTPFRAPGDIDTYIAIRRGVLDTLARTSPDRQLTVFVSPSEKVSLAEFGNILRRHDMTLEEVSVDVLVDEKWDRTVAFDSSSAIVNISEHPERLARRVLEIETSRPALPGGGDELPRDRTSVAARHVRARGSAMSAALLQMERTILLVDPTADIEDAFKHEGGEIKSIAMPHLYVERELRFGTLYGPENRRGRATSSPVTQ